VETAGALRHGRRSVVDYVSEVLDRVDMVDPVLRAVLPEPNRRDRLLDDAHALERRYPDPESRPPLYGILLGVKDLLNVDGLPTRCGSAVPPEIFAGPESTVVRTLRTHGALVFGKTTLDEFAYVEPASTRNPVNPAHSPGGSSSGSAAGVGAGFFPLGIGSQSTRSLIGPAAFSGVVGFKPTHGRVPTDGLTYLAPSLDTIGFFAQDTAGVHLAAALAVPDWVRPDPPELPRIGVPAGCFLEPVSGEPSRVFEAQLESLRWAGYEIREVFFYTREDLKALHRQVMNLLRGEMARVHSTWFRDHGSLYRPGTARAIEKGREIPESELARAREAQQTIREAVTRLMDDHGIDLWTCPSSNGPAPRGDRPTGYGAMTAIWSAAGMPCISLPGAATASGLPLGLQLIGRHGADELLVDWARFIHRKLVG
jgi:Asp-tRNA(Asn)/Glu-tRNA(Gln) amidotransferase A subunit family amidase